VRRKQRKHFRPIVALTSTAGLTHADAAFVAGASVRLMLTLGLSEAAARHACLTLRNAPAGTASLLCMPPVISVWWKKRMRDSGRNIPRVDTLQVVYGSLLLLPVSLVWLSDGAIRWRHCSFFVK
jgi:hypothetical protein